MRLKTIVAACLLAGIALLLYAFHLSAAPLTADESAFNAQAESISGSRTPLFFHVREERWLQPAAVYANAVARGLGGDDLSGRFASAVAGAINIALVFIIARVTSGRLWVGLTAAIVLMLTPAHWSLARLGTDAMLPVPLILLWLLNVLRFLKLDSWRSLAAAAAALGLSIYSHPAAPLTAVFLWILTIVVARRRNPTRLLVATIVFGAAWLPALYWFFRHPETYADTFGRWFVFAAHLRSPADALSAFVNPNTLGSRASLYWGFWDPSWLFFGMGGPAPLMLIALPLMVLGAYRCARRLPRDIGALVLGAALIAPLSGASFSVPHYITGAASVLPILALLSALGLDQLVSRVIRRPLEDEEARPGAEGWDPDHLLPRS